MKAFLVKLQEGFKSLGLASQLGITLGLSLAMLAGVYSISQVMNPMQKVTQVVEVQTSVPANSSTPSNSTEKKEVADNKQEKKQTQETTETVTTEEPVVTTEERNAREVEQGVAAVERNTNRVNNETSNSQQTKEASSTEVPTVTSVAETVTTTAYPLKLLGNTGKEFATKEQALAWMKDQLDQSSKAQEAGKQDWVYSGRAYKIPWSDGTKTYTVDLTKVEVQRPEPTTEATTSEQTSGTPSTNHL